MKHLKLILTVFIALVFVGCKDAPLKSWNNTKTKKEILAYVETVTDKQNKKFIPVSQRVAVFDLDGTLIPEQPAVMEMYMASKGLEAVKKTKSLASREPYKTIWDSDGLKLPKNMNKKMFADLYARTQTGTSLEAFKLDADQFLASAVYPKLNLPLAKIAYKPQKQLIDYLRANGFTIYICTGSEVELVRSFSDELFGIEPNYVIGSTVKYSYDKKTNMIVRMLADVNINNEERKPSNIAAAIGIIPVVAVGNVRSGGDIYMLRYSQSSPYQSLQLMVNHDDEAREFAYVEKDNISLNEAAKYGWTVVSMKDDWKDIFGK